MPDLRNLWVNPKVKLLSDEPVDSETEQTRQARVQVTGLMCYSLWVDRTKAALAGLSGVERVEFTQEAEGDIFTLYYNRPTPLTFEEVREAVLDKVVVQGARAGLEKVGQLTGLVGAKSENRS